MTVSVRILRHAVEMNGGLSPLQARILNDPAPVRIYSAPTGTGKSYAFMKAVMRGERILFIVPTRRLAQNLKQSTIELLTDFHCATGLDRQEAEAKALDYVYLWTSDERERQDQEGIDVRIQRRNELKHGAGGSGRLGDIIIATPESVASFMVRQYARKGAPVTGIWDLIEIDHVVFDEFHTIEARGFGMAAAFAFLASQLNGGFKVTFLSATPVDIVPALLAVGLVRESISVCSERVTTGTFEQTPGMRAVHGDMDIHFSEGITLVDLLRMKTSEVEQCVSGGRQVVIIYDSMTRLQKDKPELAVILDGIGVGRADRLAINSADDSVKGESGSTLFSEGRALDPLKYKVLVCTSSVEMGVTFKAGLMFMEPGFDAMSFLQRVGRPARGDETGAVHVSCPKEFTRKEWLESAFQGLVGSRDISVDEFIGHFVRDTERRFAGEVPSEESQVTFSSMPTRAALVAGLFWAALEKAPNAHHRGRKLFLKEYAPRKVTEFVRNKLRELYRTDDEYAVRWADAFLNEALTLRTISPTVTVKDSNGESRTIGVYHYNSSGYLLSSPSFLTEKGELVVQIDRTFEHAVGTLGEVVSAPRVKLLTTLSGAPLSVPMRSPVDEWIRHVAGQMKFLDYRMVRAAEVSLELVRATRIVPTAADGVLSSLDGASLTV